MESKAEHILFGTVYVVLMRRYGGDEGHSYIAGVHSSFDKAFEAGLLEKDWRGGKYDAEIIKAFLDKDSAGPNKKENVKRVMKCEDFEIARKEYKAKNGT